MKHQDDPGLLFRLLVNRRNYSVNSFRLLFAAMNVPMSVPGNINCNKLRFDGIEAESILPTDREAPNTILFLHGGGYMMGSIATHRPVASRLGLAASARVLLPEYRRAPQHPFPAALDDALSAYRYLTNEPGGTNRPGLVGDSAGGGLILALMMLLRDNNEQLPQAAYLMSPWVDLTGGNNSAESGQTGRRTFIEHGLRHIAGMYTTGNDPKNPLISPIFGDLTGLPPILLHAGRSEMLAGDAVRIAKRLEEFNVPVTFEQYEGSVHCLPAFSPVSQEAKRLLNGAGQFLSQHCSKNGS